MSAATRAKQGRQDKIKSRAGQGGAGRGRAGQGRQGKFDSRAGQGRAGQGRAGQL